MGLDGVAHGTILYADGIEAASRLHRGRPRWASTGAANGTNLYADGIEAASRLHRGWPRWASMGAANGTNLYAGGIQAASRLHRGWPRWASMGGANGSNLHAGGIEAASRAPAAALLDQNQSLRTTRTCLSQRGAGPCFGIGQLFIAPGSVLIAGWKDLGDLAQVAD